VLPAQSIFPKIADDAAGTSERPHLRASAIAEQLALRAR
jgi:hypothetical protein